MISQCAWVTGARLKTNVTGTPPNPTNIGSRIL